MGTDRLLFAEGLFLNLVQIMEERPQETMKDFGGENRLPAVTIYLQLSLVHKRTGQSLTPLLNSHKLLASVI